MDYSDAQVRRIVSGIYREKRHEDHSNNIDQAD